ncbi:MAG: histidine kinase, partial [Flavobacterium sp.]|nr:histidine kinase [Flavobacterium sp.]
NSLWLATNEGVIFTDKSLFQTKIVPEFKLLPLRANQELVQNANLIQHNKNNIEFSFQTIHYKSLGNYCYEFRVKEIDTTWNSQSSANTKVNFLALQPGNYTFEARVKSGDVYSPIQTIQFNILKPFWKSLWFLVLMLVCLFLLLYFVFRYAVLKTKQKQEIKEKLALSQLTALRSQMNPHFMYNVLNAVQGLIYSNQKTKASDYLGTFSDLMRKTLDISDKKEITIQEEMEAIELYVSLEKARFEKDDFHYTIQKPDEEDLNEFVIPSLIIQPFVENAIKHGLLHKQGLKKLEIVIRKENENYWLFEITDNGIGRKKSEQINQKIKKYDSFATKAISNRIELINKMSKLPVTIEILDIENAQDFLGTKVILKIPVKKR